MILLQLYIEFFKIGTVAFGGGYAVLPLIREFIVEKQGWITMAEMTDLVSISNMTPGPIAINAATFAGTKVSGLPGSIAATMGIMTPSAILMILLGYLLFGSNIRLSFMDKILVTLRPTVVGLIGIASLEMASSSIVGGDGYLFLGRFSTLEMITFGIGLVLYYKGVDLIKLIALGATLGIVLSIFI